MTFNGLSAKMMPKSLREITAEKNVKISPAGFAFAIWGIIYAILLIFVVYQALPSSWVPSRNDKLIFEDIGYIFFANMLLNGLWLVLFQTNTKIGFVLAMIDISALLYTNFLMMMSSTRAKVNACEFISMRIGFAVYCGWVNSATILNIIYLSISFDIKCANEEQIGVFTLWVAFIVYNAVTFLERNPIYGAIYIWTTYAIKRNIEMNKPELESLLKHVKIINILHIATILGMTGYIAFSPS